MGADGTVAGAVRPAHAIDEERLAAYLRERLPDAHGAMKLSQFAYGQSNPTYIVRFGEAEYVLRKQPPGELLPSAHQVDREFRVQQALHGTGFPVARQYLYCDDRSVVGTPFYVMERMRGRVFTDSALPGVSPDERRAMYVSVAETLARLHRIDPAEIGLSDFGRPGNYYERQFRRWARNYEQTKTRDIPEMYRLMEWLPEHMPAGDETRIVHGDYRIGNVMFHPTEPRVIAVFDWEIATLGHPLADLAYLCILYFTSADEFHGLIDRETESAGVPPYEELIELYRVAAGRDDTLTSAHMAHAMFRFAAILDGVRARGLAGNAAAEDAEDVGRQAVALAKRAWAAAGGG